MADADTGEPSCPSCFKYQTNIGGKQGPAVLKLEDGERTLYVIKKDDGKLYAQTTKPENNDGHFFVSTLAINISCCNSSETRLVIQGAVDEYEDPDSYVSQPDDSFMLARAESVNGSDNDWSLDVNMIFNAGVTTMGALRKPGWYFVTSGTESGTGKLQCTVYPDPIVCAHTVSGDGPFPLIIRSKTEGTGEGYAYKFTWN
ncbi:uncharacterized protein LOC135812763 [Sycon ciliatum]|uniref:uncharacterized protein LOC135812763 n=1 Tax=Sycon ciliatum TaxID=27933 RepID=UPI0031F71D86